MTGYRERTARSIRRISHLARMLATNPRATNEAANDADQEPVSLPVERS